MNMEQLIDVVWILCVVKCRVMIQLASRKCGIHSLQNSSSRTTPHNRTSLLQQTTQKNNDVVNANVFVLTTSSPRIPCLQVIPLLTAIPTSPFRKSSPLCAVSIATKIASRLLRSMTNVATTKSTTSRTATLTCIAQIFQKRWYFLICNQLPSSHLLLSSSKSYKSRAIGRLFSLMKLIATPVFPARPVRPIRCT